MYKISNNIENIIGDILEVPTQMICHQVNCQGVMGAGLAKQVRTAYPQVYELYKQYCEKQTEKANLLGRVQFIKCPNNVIIANCFAQFGYGRGALQTSYAAFRLCMLKIKNFCKTNSINCVSIPYKMGCGLAGGNWEIISKIIAEIFDGENIKIQIVRRI